MTLFAYYYFSSEKIFSKFILNRFSICLTDILRITSPLIPYIILQRLRRRFISSYIVISIFSGFLFTAIFFGRHFSYFCSRLSLTAILLTCFFFRFGFTVIFLTHFLTFVLELFSCFFCSPPFFLFLLFSAIFLTRFSYFVLPPCSLFTRLLLALITTCFPDFAKFFIQLIHSVQDQMSTHVTGLQSTIVVSRGVQKEIKWLYYEGI